MKQLTEKNAKEFALRKFRELPELNFKWNLIHLEGIIKILKILCKDKSIDKSKLFALAWVHDTGKTISEEDLENIVSLLEGRDLSHWLFNICGPCVSNLEYSTYTIPLSKGAKLFERFYESAKRKNVRLVTPVPICDLNPEMYKDMKENKAISHGCHILFGTNFVLDPNGDVLPCVHFSNYPIFNVYEEGKVMSPERFRNLWDDPKETNQQFRKILRRYPSKKCSEGDCWNPCTGGCSVFWLKYDPEKEIRGLKQDA